MNSRPLIASAAKALLASRGSTVVFNNGSGFSRILRNSSYYKPAASWKPAHLDEMPVPQGSWKTDYDAHQKKYNMHLGIGVAFFVFTVGFIKTSGIIFFNAFPPELPEADC